MGLKAPVTDIAGSDVLALGVQPWNRRPASEDAPAQNLSAEDKAEAERRFCVIEPLVFPDRFPELWQECRGRRGAVEQHLSIQHGRPPRTIRDWAKKFKEHGIPGLVTRDRADKGIRRKSNRAARELIRALAIPKRGVFGTLSGAEMFRAYEEERGWRQERIGQALRGPDAERYSRYLDEDGRLSERARLPQMTYKTFHHQVADIPEAVLTLARDGEEAYRNSQEIISHRDIADVEPLAWLVMDHRILDVFCRFPVRGGWKLARPWITCAIDMRTRKWLGWGVFEVPSSDSIATVLKKVFIDHGVPQNCYWDNGRDFRCEYLEGGHTQSESAGPTGDLDPTWRGVLGALGVRVTHAIVRNARAKLIEPNFGRVANFDKQLPEYCGHRPSERPERLDVMVKQHEAWLRGERPASPFRTIQEIAALYDAALSDLNERELHGEGMSKTTPTGMGWMAPNECWELLIGRVERRTVRIEDLHIVFSRRRTLTVKHGEVCATFGGQKFHYRLEGEPTELMALNGQFVEIAYDPHELGQAAVYWRDRFVGLAHCIPLRKMGEDSFVDDERNRRAVRRDIKRAIDAVHQIPVASPEERLARRREVLPVRAADGRVEIPVALPPAMREAEAAIRADQEFCFENAAADVACATQPAAADVESEFHFFSDQGD